jgi:hypothetical protein
MTGLLDRLRAWLGGVFGGGASDANDADDADESGLAVSNARSNAQSEAPERQVVHRDDRPLETPSAMDRGGEDAPSRTDAAEPTESSPPRVDIPDAEGGIAPESAEGDVPDAEATAGGDGADGAAETRADETPEPATPAAAGRESERTSVETTGSDADDDSSDAAFACSVCGTTVDDPSDPCPLCRSTDVVSVADASAEEVEESFTRGGRTAVSTTDDDEAVDRLRDVRDGE